jgi:hypothetical protein
MSGDSAAEIGNAVPNIPRVCHTCMYLVYVVNIKLTPEPQREY